MRQCHKFFNLGFIIEDTSHFYLLSFYYMHLCREDRLEPKDSSFINGFSLPFVFFKSFFFISVFFSFLSSLWIMLYLYIYRSRN